MIIVRIDAGMGNQMFKYAAGLSLAQKFNTELLLDIHDKNNKNSDMMNPLTRPYCLECFPNITEREATFENVHNYSFLLAFWLYIKRNIRRRNIFRRLISYTIEKFFIANHLYNERQTSKKHTFYNHEFENLTDNIWWIEGNYQAEKYFKKISEIIRQKFTFSQECFNQKLLTQVQNCNSIAFHIRRGDKVNRKNFTPTTEEYIKVAVEKIYDLTTEPEFFIFSDDLEWCKKILPQIRDINWHFQNANT